MKRIFLLDYLCSYVDLCRDLLNVAKKRTNVVPIIEDARHPHKYRMLIPMVDTGDTSLLT